MKYLITLVLVIGAMASSADEIRVRRMKRDGTMDRSFVLKTNLSQKVVLDCQSFIQGLRIGEYEDAYTYLLGPEECEELQGRIRTSLKRFRSHCIEVGEDIQSDKSCF